jgi:hypothetical protein
MRLILAALVAALPLVGGPASAAPQFAMPQRSELGTAAPLRLAAGGCGIGFHRQRWRDRYGRWHLRCVPNR